MSVEAAALLSRIKVGATYVRNASNTVPDLLTTWVNTGVQTEVTGLALPTTIVPNCGTITKQEYLDIVAMLTELDKYWTNQAVVTQNNRSFVQKIFEGA